LSTLRNQNWSAFSGYAVPNLLIAQYMVAYEQFFKNQFYVHEEGCKEELWQVAFPAVLFDEKDIEQWGRSKSRLGFYTVLQTRISTTRRHLSPSEQHVFREFCVLVKETYNHSIIISENEHMPDLKELVGPSIIGRRMSNVSWRVGLCMHKGNWFVQNLIVATH